MTEPVKKPRPMTIAQMASKGGRSKSPAKVAAVRENVRKARLVLAEKLKKAKAEAPNV